MTASPNPNVSVDRCLAGEGNAHDAAQILVRCRQDEAFLDEVSTLAMIERLLRFQHAATTPELFAAETVKRLELSGSGDQFVARVLPRLERNGRPGTSQGRHTLPWLIPLATAAAVLATVGMFLLREGQRPEPTYAIGRISKSIGPVLAQDQDSAGRLTSALSTSTNGSCLIEQEDGSLVAMAQSSSLGWQQDPSTRAKTLDLKAGQAYLDLRPQPAPYLIRFASGAQASVMGTRLLVNQDYPPFCSVFQGRVKYRNGPASFLLEAGDTATAASSRFGGGVAVSGNGLDPQQLIWLGTLGLNPQPILTLRPGPKATAGGGMMDLSRFIVPGGSWKRGVARNGSVSWIQENADGFAESLFGDTKWVKGRLSCKFRVTKLGKAPKGFGQAVHLSAGYEDGAGDGFGVAGTLPYLMEKDGDINLTLAFEVDEEQNSIVWRTIKAWNDADPATVLDYKDMMRTPLNSAVGKRGPCRLGVRTVGCAAEFWDLRLEDAVAAPTPGELWPWVAAYYKRYDQWVLQRETFTNGEILAVLSPAQLKLANAQGNARARLIRHAMKDGKEGEALSVENPGAEYCAVTFRIPGALPDAFAMEIDIMPVRKIPVEGKELSAPFYYQSNYEEPGTRPPQFAISKDLVSDAMFRLQKQPADARGYLLTPQQWRPYRVEFFRVGRYLTGEPLYETRIPSSTDSGLRFDAKWTDTSALMFRGCEVLVGEVRIQRLLPPAGLERGPGDPAAR